MMDSPIEDIKQRLNITDILADYVQMKKAGTNFKAVCPFHNEKTPSLMISPSKQIWHCFGCGLGGDIFEFVKLSEHIEFGEALRILANRAGVELKKPTEQDIRIDQKKDVLFEINDLAAQYYERVLWESPAAKKALDYLRKRGLSDQTMKKWRLGFAPDDFHYLENFLSKKFSREDIAQAGLIVKKEQGSGYFDRFRGRVMFTIVNVHGQVVGFTGRLLEERENTGKYVNSPETPIYNKGHELYGLYAAKNHVRKQNRCLIVEGNMDVISLHQAGTEIAVASSGTALGNEQLNVIKRFTDNLVFAFDTDAAGLTATKRALESALNLGFNVRIVRMQNAKDPDELIRKGIGIWQKALDGAVNFLEFFFEKTFQQYDPQEVESKRAITKELLPLMIRISDPVTKAHFIRKLSNGLNVAETAIWDMVNKAGKPKLLAAVKEERAKKDKKHILEEKMLGLMLVASDTEQLKNLDEFYFAEENREVYRVLVAEKAPKAAALKKKHPELGDRVTFLEFAAESELAEQSAEAKQELDLTAHDYKRLVMKAKMEQISSQLATAQQEKNQELLQRLSQEFSQLSIEYSQLN